MSDTREIAQEPENHEKSAAALRTHVENIQTDEVEAVKWDVLRQDAIAGEEAERALSLGESFRLYPKAIFWSFSVSIRLDSSLTRADIPLHHHGGLRSRK